MGDNIRNKAIFEFKLQKLFQKNNHYLAFLKVTLMLLNGKSFPNTTKYVGVYLFVVTEN